MRSVPSIHRGVVIALTAALALAWAPSCRAGGSDAGAAPPDSSRADLTEVRDRAEAMPVEPRIDMEKRIRATIDKVNDAVSGRGQVALAAKLAPGFAMTAEGLLDEKGRLGWTWGDMVVAHTLLSDAARKVTLFDLESLRADGLGWAAIAYGLQFHMEDLEDVIKAGGRIATGQSVSDGGSHQTR